MQKPDLVSVPVPVVSTLPPKPVPMVKQNGVSVFGYAIDFLILQKKFFFLHENNVLFL